jgi:glycyl-tRNA synthetase alpha chain
MYIQDVDNVYDVIWTGNITYGDIHHQTEVDYSYYNFEEADTGMLFNLFEMYEQEAERIGGKGLVQPAYDYVLKCSHVFNLLDARGALSVAERTSYIGRIRHLARLCARAYLDQREQLGYPLIKNPEQRDALQLSEPENN